MLRRGLFALLLLVSCDAAPETAGPPPDITTGQAAIDLAGRTIVRVPAYTTVKVKPTFGKVVLVVTRKTQIVKQPEEPITKEVARRNMGCAWRDAEGALLVATYGEFTVVEGRASIELHVTVPAGVMVRHDITLGGPTSIAAARNGDRIPIGIWFGPAHPAEGWQPVPDEPV